MEGVRRLSEGCEGKCHVSHPLWVAVLTWVTLIHFQNGNFHLPFMQPPRLTCLNWVEPRRMVLSLLRYYQPIPGRRRVGVTVPMPPCAPVPYNGDLNG